MIAPALHAPPSGVSVFALQVRKVGRILRPELIGLALLMGLILLLGSSLMFLDGDALDYPEELDFVIPLAAFILPFRLWRGERLFGGAELWTLPVERQKHALLRIAAGAIWVVLLVVVVVVIFNLLAMVSGGTTAAESHRLFLSGVHLLAGGSKPWLGLVPLGGALTAYLLASALAVGVRHPLRWTAGLIVAGLLVALIGPEFGLQPAGESLIYGSLGLDQLLTGGVSVFEARLQGADAATASALLWTAPAASRWAVALVFWLGLGLIAVGLASARHRER